MISPSQRPLPDNTQHSKQTNIHAPGGIRTHNLSRQTVADPRLRPRGRDVRISGSNAGYTVFRGGKKGAGYTLHSPVFPSFHLPCVTVCRNAPQFCSTYISYLVFLGVEIHTPSVKLLLSTSLLFIIWTIGDLTGSNDGMLLVAEAPTTEKEIHLLPVCLPPI